MYYYRLYLKKIIVYVPFRECNVLVWFQTISLFAISISLEAGEWKFCEFFCQHVRLNPQIHMNDAPMLSVLMLLFKCPGGINEEKWDFYNWKNITCKMCHFNSYIYCCAAILKNIVTPQILHKYSTNFLPRVTVACNCSLAFSHPRLSKASPVYILVFFLIVSSRCWEL